MWASHLTVTFVALGPAKSVIYIVTYKSDMRASRLTVTFVELGPTKSVIYIVT